MEADRQEDISMELVVILILLVGLPLAERQWRLAGR
jgi:hypothetical protein